MTLCHLPLPTSTMPLSRLSQRSRRTGLKRQGRTSSQPTQASRHHRLWEAIRTTREEINNWQIRADYIQGQFQNTILPREHRITDSVQQLTHLVIEHFQNPKRDAAERSLLGLWIIHNLGSLATHPFASKAQSNELLIQFSQTLDSDDAIDSQLLRLLQNNEPEADRASDTASFYAQDDESELDEEEITFDFGWHKSADVETPHAQSSRVDEEPTPSSAYSTSTENDVDEGTASVLDEKINTLEQKLSINRLFRQLAKVLHPDREQDETLKAEKHLLMSQCLEARQNKDIDTLLELYCEHVGELPEGLTDDSHEELISALELQLKQLQRELRQQRFGDALQAQIVERYSDSSNTGVQQKIAKHAKELDRVIADNERTQRQLATEVGLQLALVERRAIELDRMSIDELTGG